MALGGVAAAQATGEAGTLERLNMREVQLSAEQGRNLNRFSRLLTVLIRYRLDPPPALLVSPGDAVDAARAAILIKSLTPELETRARTYAREAAEITRQRRLAAVAAEALFTADSYEADRLNGPPEGSRIDPQTDLADTRPVVAPVTLLPPAEGQVIRRFGDRIQGGGRAQGLTIQTRTGARVEAPGDAAVQYVGPVKGWGVVVILRLAGGYHLVLGGLDRATVSVGQSLGAGAPVGWMAQTGEAAPQLYVEVRERGETVNPGRWIAG